MSLEKAKKYLEEKGYADHVIELEESSALSAVSFAEEVFLPNLFLCVISG